MEENNKDFYSKIATALYCRNYKIGPHNCMNYKNFIEKKRDVSSIKDGTFYLNLIQAMPVKGERIADITKGEIPSYKEKIFTEVFAYCNSRLSSYTISKVEKQKVQLLHKKILTYDWIGKPQNKTVLFKILKDVFIDKETKVKDFCNIFENVNTAGIKPIKWIMLPTDLLLFLNEMMNEGLIKDERKRMNWLKLNACFCKADGSRFTEALRSIFKQIKDEITTEKKDIKELVKSLK